MRAETEDGALGSVEETAFRRGMGRLAGGVCVLTSVIDERYCGLTATSVTSVSLHPPLIAVSVDDRTETSCGIGQCKAFGISILNSRQEPIARRFATNGLRRKFTGVRVRKGLTGVPLIEDAHAAIECVVWARHVAGDHLLYLGRVIWAETGHATEPLAYHMGNYSGIVDTGRHLGARLGGGE